MILYLGGIGLISLITKRAFITFFSFVNIQGTVFISFGHLWYIPVMLVCYLLLYPLKKFNEANIKYKKLIQIIFLVILILIDLVFSNFVQIVFIPFLSGYFFGKFYSKPKENPKKSKLFWIITSLIIFIIFSALYFFIKTKNIYLPINSIYKILCEILTAGLGISFSILLIYVFEFLNNKKIKVFYYTDKYSFHFISSSILIVTPVGLLPITNYSSINIISRFSL